MHIYIRINDGGCGRTKKSSPSTWELFSSCFFFPVFETRKKPLSCEASSLGHTVDASEIPRPTMFLKPCKKWDFFAISTGAGSINSITRYVYICIYILEDYIRFLFWGIIPMPKYKVSYDHLSTAFCRR